MNKKEKLEEATLLALQGKLTESNEVEQAREMLQKIRSKFKTINRSNYMYKELLKDEKYYLKELKKALSKEKGTYITATQVTNAIKKLAQMEKYTDSTTSVRGFHWYGKGDFSVDTDSFNNSFNEDDLYYDVYFYGKNSSEKANIVYNALNDNGYIVKKIGGEDSDHLTVASYK